MTARKKPEDLLPRGRPTVYRPEFCERVIELGRLGYTKAMMAEDLGVARITLDAWASEKPEFSSALTRARDLALSFMERKGISGLEKNQFNHGLYKILMVGMFPADYRDNSRVELTGAGGAPIQTVTSLKIEFATSVNADDSSSEET